MLVTVYSSPTLSTRHINIKWGRVHFIKASAFCVLVLSDRVTPLSTWSPALILDIFPARVLTSQWVQSLDTHIHFYQEIIKAAIDISRFDKVFCKKKKHSKERILNPLTPDSIKQNALISQNKLH